MSTVTAVPLQPTRRRVLVYLWAGLTIAVAAAALLVWLTPVDPIVRALADVRRSDPLIRSTPSGLLYKVLEPGQGGPHPTDEDVALTMLQIHLLDGTLVGGGDQPTPIPVSGVPAGLSEALKMMPKGSRYRFWIKPSLGFGDRAPGTIPPNSTLVVDAQLMDFRSQAVLQQMEAMRQMQQQQGGAPAGPGSLGAPGAAPGGMPAGPSAGPAVPPAGAPQP